jgi:hypothetical protein
LLTTLDLDRAMLTSRRFFLSTASSLIFCVASMSIANGSALADDDGGDFLADDGEVLLTDAGGIFLFAPR